jgi:hypothetical protein
MADNNVNRFSQADAANANSMAQAARSLTEELKDQLGIRSRLNETQRETLNLARELQMSAQQNTVEIGNSGSIEKQIAKDVKINLNLRRELLDVQKDITEDIKLELELLKEADELGEEAYIKAFQSASQETQKIALLQKSIDLSNTLIQQRKEEAAVQQKINDRMGVTGSIVKGIGGLMQKLGMSSEIFQDAMKNSTEVMREMAEQTERGTANFSKLQIMAKGFSELAKGFTKALTDPLVIITGILDGFFKVNKATVDLQRLTGQYETSIAGVNDRLATSAQFLETAAELTKELGVSATLVFTPDQIAQLAEAKNLLGLSAEEAGRMGILMKLTGKSADNIGQGIYDTVNAYNGANQAGIAHGVVLQDVLSASDSITASLGNSEKKIGAAATAARGLGLSLSEVDEIAGNLMNFEESIGNELEAQLITGKNINLSKARELALNNDLEGVANELKKNGASAAEFAGMQRFEQESLAKALGMSRDQLAKSVLTQEAMNSMTAEQIAKARGVTLEQSKAMDVQAKLETAIQKLTQAFAPLLDAVVPIVDALLSVIKPFAQLIAIVAGNPFGKLAIGALALASALGVVSLKTIANTVATSLSTAATVAWNVTKGASLALWNSTIMLTVREKVALVANTAARYASIAAESAWNGAKKVGILLGNTAIGQYLIEKANLLATTVAKWANVGATTAQTAANAGLAASNTTLGATGAAAGGGMAAAGAGLGAFGAAAAPAIPVILAIGAALLMASPAIWAFSKVVEALGTVIIGAMKELPAIITAVADGFVKIIGAVSMDNIGPMLLLGPALFGIAAGLGAVALAGLTAIPAIGGLVLLASVAPKLASIGIGGEKKSAGEAKGKGEGSDLEKKIEQLITAINKGHIVNVKLDKKVLAQASIRYIPEEVTATK